MDVQIFRDFRYSQNFIVVLHLATFRRPRPLISQFVEDSFKVGKKHSRWAFIARFRHKGQLANSKHPAYAGTLVKAHVRIADRMLATLWRVSKMIFANRFVPNALLGREIQPKSAAKELRDFEGRGCELSPRLNQDDEAAGKNTSVRTSILSRAGASAELLGAANAVLAVKRVRPGSES